MILEIDPVFIDLGFTEIRWYGITMLVGVLSGFFIGVRLFKKYNISYDTLLMLLVFGIPISLFCARFYDVIFSFDPSYWEYPPKILGFYPDGEFKGLRGLSIHGAIIGMIITGVTICRIKNISFLLITDALAPCILIGQVFGRIGNFINQEAYGFSISRSSFEDFGLPDWFIEQMYVEGSYHHPTFLYEMLLNLIGCSLLLVAHFYFSAKLKRGDIFAGFLIWYGFVRFIIEGIRVDSFFVKGPIWFQKFIDLIWSPFTLIWGNQPLLEPGTLRVAQLTSLIMVMTGVIFFFLVRRKSQSNNLALLKIKEESDSLHPPEPPEVRQFGEYSKK